MGSNNGDRDFERKNRLAARTPSGNLASMRTHESTLQDGRWAAIVTRDRQADGAFVYAVRTTGIYCRPTCPSRRAKRENVEFFEVAQEAESRGYRPCRRCRPHAADGTPTDRTVAAARAFLDAHPLERVPLARVARAVGASPWHLQRAFSRVVGVSPKAYHDALRRAGLKAELHNGQTVSRAAMAAGYASPGPVYARAASALGMTPGRYRRGGAGLTIRYGLMETPLGLLLVAATERGVAAVSLGDAAGPLERALTREFPAATLMRDDTAVRSYADAIIADPSTVPLDVAGTDFQRRVWDALRAIPVGTTRSYSEVAAAIGRPTAARAVASACAHNPAALVVPCHRVVRSDGAMGGYRWGEARKRSLLAREASAVEASAVASSSIRPKRGASKAASAAVRPAGDSGAA
jgi:AraC family transcriptional regulator of adaptative response/methylated-DNA-[protein]-cysteine methyltransferase